MLASMEPFSVLRRTSGSGAEFPPPTAFFVQQAFGTCDVTDVDDDDLESAAAAAWAAEEEAAEDFTNSCSILRADRCPSCLAPFLPGALPTDKWDAVRVHIKACDASLPGKLASTATSHLSAAELEDFDAFGCPVPGCRRRYRYHRDIYGHVLGSSAVDHVAYRGTLVNAKLAAAAAASGLKIGPATTGQCPRVPSRHGPRAASLAARLAEDRRRAQQAKKRRKQDLKALKILVSKQLYSAAKSNDPAGVDALLAEGAAVRCDPNAGGEDGFTPLMTAAEAGYDAVLDRLLLSGRVRVNVRNSYGQTALAFAAQNGRTAAVESLLRCPRVNPRITTGGLTAAELARGAGHHAVATLIEAGADDYTARAEARAYKAQIAQLDQGHWDTVDELADRLANQMDPHDNICGGGLSYHTKVPGRNQLRPVKHRGKDGPSVMSMKDRLVRVRPPTKAELSAVTTAEDAAMKAAATRVRALGLDIGERIAEADPRCKRNAATDPRCKRHAATDRPRPCYSRGAFLAKHRAAVQDEFPDARIVPAPVSKMVLRRFQAAVEAHGGVIPEVGFHGSRAVNFASICAKGLLNPSKHASIPSCIPGVYTTKLGNGEYSRYYTDSPDVFVCGIVLPHNNTVATAATADAVTKKPPKRFKLQGQHREHRKSDQLLTYKEPRLTRRGVEDYSGVRVIHDEQLVAPLFVAKGAYANATPAQPHQPCRSREVHQVNCEPGISRNKRTAPAWAGRHKRAIAGTDEAVWLASTEAHTGGFYQKTKRRFECKRRHLDRRAARQAKRMDQDFYDCRPVADPGAPVLNGVRTAAGDVKKPAPRAELSMEDTADKNTGDGNVADERRLWVDVVDMETASVEIDIDDPLIDWVTVDDTDVAGFDHDSRWTVY